MEYICGFIFLSALFFLFALQSVIDISPEDCTLDQYFLGHLIS